MSSPKRPFGKRLKKFFLWSLLVLGLLLIGGLIVLQIWISRNINPAAFVLQIEKDKNLRCEIDRVEVHLFAHPSYIDLHGVRFAPRDDLANRKVPFDQRPAMDPETVLVTMESASIRVSLWSLWERKLDLRKLVAKEMVMTGTIDSEGNNNIEELFQKPPKPKGKPNVKTDTKWFSKPELFTEIGLAGIESGSMEFLLEADQKKVRLEKMRILFDGVVDPENLAQSNTLQMDFSGDLYVEDLVTKKELALLTITAKGPVNPYDPATGKFDPIVNVQMTVHKGSRVEVTPVRDLLKDRPEDLQRLTDFGLDVDRFKAGGAIQQDALIPLLHDKTRTTVQDDVTLWFPDFALGLEKGDFVDVNERFLRVHPKFTASPAVSQELIGMVEVKVAEKTNEDIAKVLTLLLEPLRDDEGRISLTIKGRGPFDEVEWGIDTPLSDVGDVIGDAVGGLLDGLLGEDDKKKEEEEEAKRKKRELRRKMELKRQQEDPNNPSPKPPAPKAKPDSDLTPV